MAKAGARDKLTLACTECKQRNYQTYKNNWSLERKARLTNIADLNSISVDQQSILIKISEALHEACEAEGIG